MRPCNVDSFHIGAKALIFNSEGNILLLERDHPIKKLYWDLPGGRVQKDESILEALQRELKEELGLTIFPTFHPFGMFLTNIRLPYQEDSVGLIFSVFKCQLSNQFDPFLSDEHINFEWFTSLQLAERLKIQYPSDFIAKLQISSNDSDELNL